MTTLSSNNEPKTNQTTPPTETPKTDVVPEPLKFYEPEAKKEEAPKAEVPPVNPPIPPKEEKIEDPATGYGEDLKVETPKVPDAPPAELTEEQKAEKEIVEAVKLLGDGYDHEKIKKFAVDNKFSKAQVEAYVKQTKDEQDASIKKYQEDIKVQRAAWQSDLKKDPHFGGEEYAKNVDRVEKVLQNHMPETKKMLTEKGGMLPPYIMKDLLKVAKALDPKTNFVGGEPPMPPKKEEKDPLDFYT